MIPPVCIRRYLEVEATPQRAAEIDRIFYESSNTKSFESEDVKAAFRERWLGRYLRHDARFTYVAQIEGGTIVGYLVGATDDPAKTARFADIAYFAELENYTRRFPAHLHVNVRADFRNHGIGAQLIGRFVDDAQRMGVPGVHVVTSADAANVSFYNRNGFAEVARAGRLNCLVFLGRPL